MELRLCSGGLGDDIMASPPKNIGEGIGGFFRKKSRSRDFLLRAGEGDRAGRLAPCVLGDVKKGGRGKGEGASPGFRSTPNLRKRR